MKTAIIGRGAIGILYAMQMRQYGCQPDILVDPIRKQRYENTPLTVNGQPVHFHYVVPDGTTTYDLILIMTKIGGLASALETIAPAVGDDTILLSCLNGITSEDVVRARFPANPVIRTIVQGMDTVYLNDECTFSHIGQILIGAETPEEIPVVDRLKDYFDTIHMPCQVCEDIILAQWNKLMLNCGVNQICAAHDCGYHDAVTTYRPQFIQAMTEVKTVANALDIPLTDKDIENWLTVCEGLEGDAMPSMAQDMKAGRKTELELFSGTIVPLAHDLHIPVPELEDLQKRIEKIEQAS